MPTYEYQCAQCKHNLEVFQKMTDEVLRDCPKCNQPTLTKLISASGFQLKGDGWYVTDYSKKNAKPASEKSESAPASATSDSGSTKSDTKSDTKTSKE